MKTTRRKKRVNKTLRRALSMVLVWALLLASAPVPVYAAEPGSTEQAQEDKATETMEETSELEETRTTEDPPTEEGTTETMAEEAASRKEETETSPETTTEETEEAALTEAATEAVSTEAATEGPAETIEEQETEEEDMVMMLAAEEDRSNIGLAGVVNGVYHWTYKGKDAYCLTHGKTMNTSLAAAKSDESKDSQKWGQILATLLAITKGNGYNSVQYEIWKYQDSQGSKAIEYSEHAYTVKKDLGISGGKATYNAPTLKLTDADITALKTGKTVKKTFSLSAKKVKNIQKLLKAAADFNGGGTQLMVSKGSAVTDVDISNATDSSKTFTVTVTYKTGAKGSKNEVINAIKENGSVSITSEEMTFGKSLSYISWKSAKYKDHAYQLQNLAFDFEKQDASVEIKLGAAGTGSSSYHICLLKMDENGNPYVTDGEFYLTQGNTVHATLSSADAYNIGWDIEVPSLNNKEADYVELYEIMENNEIRIYEKTAPTGLIPVPTGYASQIFSGYSAVCLNGTTALWSNANTSGTHVVYTTKKDADGDSFDEDYYSYVPTTTYPVANDRIRYYISNGILPGDSVGDAYAVGVNLSNNGGIKVESKVLKVPSSFDKENQRFVNTETKLPGIAFDVYLAEADYNDLSAEPTQWFDPNSQTYRYFDNNTVNTVISTMYTDNNGTVSLRLPVGEYYVKENIDKSKISDALKELLRPAVEKMGSANASVVAGKGYVNLEFKNQMEEDSDSESSRFINTPIPVTIPVKKVYKESGTAEEIPLADAEFALYMRKDYKNILGQNILSDLAAEDAIIGVKNHQPVYESGKWVQIATAVTDENGNAEFSVLCPSYGLESAEFLIAETTPPDGYRRMDYANNTYVIPLKKEYNDTSANNEFYNANGLYLSTQKFYNTDEASMKIQVYKYGDQITGSTLHTTDYGNYYSIDRTEMYPLDKVAFDILNSRGKLVETITTDSKGYAETSVKLSSGTYTIQESARNTKFHVNQEDETAEDFWSQKVTLKPDETKELTLFPRSFTNHGIPVTLTIEKNGEAASVNPANPTEADLSQVVDINESDSEKMLNLIRQTYTYTTESLEGVVFGIYTKNEIKTFDGTTIVPAGACVGITKTDKDGVAEYTAKYPDGEYYFKEIKTADASKYILDEKEHPFTITLDGSREMSMDLTGGEPLVNEMYKGSITLIKKDKKTTYPIARVTFGLFDEQKNLISTAMTDEGGGCAWYDLPAGKYYVKELTGREGYDKNENEYPVYITRDSLNAAKVITNTEISGKIKVVKRDADDHAILISGVTFNLLDEEKNILGSYQTDENGELVTDELPLGKYYLVETRAARGYILDDTEQEINLTNDSRYPELNLYNKAKRGSIKVIKTDGTKTIYLQGVVFHLYDENHNFLASYATDKNGEIYIGQLRVGTYFLQETKTNKGYELNDDLIQVDLTDANLEVVLRLVNNKEEKKQVSLDSDSDDSISSSSRSGSVVKTGDHPFRLMLAFVFMLVSAAGCFLLSLRKKTISGVPTAASEGCSLIYWEKLGITRFFMKLLAVILMLSITVGTFGSAVEKPKAETEREQNIVLHLPDNFNSKQVGVIYKGKAFFAEDKTITIPKSYDSGSLYLLCGDLDRYSLGIVTDASSSNGNSGWDSWTSDGNTDSQKKNQYGPFHLTDLEEIHTGLNGSSLYNDHYKLEPVKNAYQFSAVLLGNQPETNAYSIQSWKGQVLARSVIRLDFNIENKRMTGIATTGIETRTFNQDIRELKLSKLLYQIFNYNDRFSSYDLLSLKRKGDSDSSEDVIRNLERWGMDVDLPVKNTPAAIPLPVPSIEGFTLTGNTISVSPDNARNCLLYQAFTQTDDVYLKTHDEETNQDILEPSSLYHLMKEEQMVTDILYTPVQKEDYQFCGSSYYIDGDKRFFAVEAEYLDGASSYSGSMQMRFYTSGGGLLWSGSAASSDSISPTTPFGSSYTFYELSKDITENGVTYHLDSNDQAAVKAITGTKVTIPQEIPWGNHLFTVSSVNADATIADTVETIALPDTIASIGAGALASENITDIYLDHPKFDTTGVFKDGVTIHCYKGADSTTSFEENYPNSALDYYKIPIAYALNGGEWESDAKVQDVIYYRNAYTVPIPLREGYTFAGWYTDAALTQPADISPYFEKIGENDPASLTYYAKWIQVINITPEEKITVDNGDYTDSTLSAAEQEQKKAQETAEAKAKAEAEAKAKADKEADAANAGLVKKGVQVIPAIASRKTGHITYSQVKGKKIKVKITKAAADGFEIQYSTKKNWKKAKTVTTVLVDGQASKTVTLKKLTKGKKYYVRARAFNLNMDGTRAYGKWTKKKAISVKK